MIATTRASLTATIAVCMALTCASLLAAPVAAGAAVIYQNETYPEYQQQLAGGQIQAVTINKYLRSLRITLKDGRYVLAKYAKHEEPAVAAALEAKHVPVTVLAQSVARKEVPKKAVHHKLRYIAGGIVIVVIVIVGAVLFINRRRTADRD
ncbi:MAG: hypothetical protein ABSG93_16160 [Solirubrobacteraceae bacterium]|jgi:hypothetical protein